MSPIQARSQHPHKRWIAASLFGKTMAWIDWSPFREIRNGFPLEGTLRCQRGMASLARPTAGTPTSAEARAD